MSALRQQRRERAKTLPVKVRNRDRALIGRKCMPCLA
jgi:hypothetical protein